MIVVSHPTGNNYVRAALRALVETGLLAGFYTTLAFDRSSGWLRLVPTGLRRELLRRAYDLPPGAARKRPLRETVRLISGRAGWTTLTRYETGWASIYAVYRDLDRHVAARLPGLASRGVRAIYAHLDGATTSFAAAQELGMRRLYELPIAYSEVAQRLLEEESRRWPEWAVTMPDLNYSAAKLEADRRELELADVVFCPSAFVAESLPAWARASRQIVVAPFGSPGLAPASSATPGKTNRGGKLRVLFAGSMSQRKGLADLFSAMKLVGRREIELVVMGSLLAPLPFYRREWADFTYEPTRPHDDVLALMSTCDVFCLPSIVEGRALVIQEAMSRGLPIIITPNTGADDLVDDGRTGFLVPVRSPAAIANRLAWFAEHREETRAMGELARAKAAACSWENYGTIITHAIKQDVGSHQALSATA